MQLSGRFFVERGDRTLHLVDGDAEERPRPIDAAKFARRGPRADVRRDPVAALEDIAVQACIKLNLTIPEVLVGRS